MWTLEAHEIVMNLYREYGNTLSPPELKKIVKDALRPIRFSEGKGYYFATRMDGVEILFADRPEMEGKNLLDMRDTHRANLSHQGHDRYHPKARKWILPIHLDQTRKTKKDFSKIAYIKYFKLFDWLIGTGEYLDDIVEDIKREVLDRLETIAFGKDGYILAGQWTD